MKRSKAALVLAQLISPNHVDEEGVLRAMHIKLYEWEEIIAIANRYLLTPVLCGLLKEKKLLDLVGDAKLKNYLQEVYALNTTGRSRSPSEPGDFFCKYEIFNKLIKCKNREKSLGTLLHVLRHFYRTFV